MARAPAQFAARRRGMTFLEVVLASALLGIVAMGVFGALNYLVLQHKRAEQLTGAAEVANRVVVMFLDNPDAMPSNGQPIPYGRHRYRWTYDAGPISVIDPNATEGQPSPLTLDRLQELTVTVWLHEDSGGASAPGPSTPGLTVRRMLDPAATRNPDSMARAIDDGRLLRGLQGGPEPRRGGSESDGATTTTGGGN